MTIQRIPGSLGLPFSTAVRVGHIWELSGQIGLDPATGRLVPGGVGPETKQALANIREVVESVGSSMHDIIKVGVFLVDITDFDEMNDAYSSFFDTQDYPSRSAIGVSGLALGAHVEIECTALAPSRGSQEPQTLRERQP